MMSDNQIRDSRIVLDALDECQPEPRKDLLDWLSAFQVQGVHFLLMSRKEDDIALSLAKWIPAAATISIQRKAVDDDIREVVHSMITKDKDFERWSDRPKVRKEMESKIMAKSGGM